MRNRRALLVCVAGVAVCLVLLALLQSPSIDDGPRGVQRRDDHDVVPDVGNNRPKQFRYDSLRYLAPKERASEMVVPDSERLESDRLQRQEPPSVTQANELASWQMQTSKSSMRVGGKRRRHKFARNRAEQPPNWPSTLFYDRKSPPIEFGNWNTTPTAFCASPPPFQRGARSRSQLTAYGNLFAELRNVVIDRNHCRCNLKGGELIEDVVGQDESDEYYQVDRGCFELACDEIQSTPGKRTWYHFEGTDHLNKWLSNGVRFIGSTGDGRKQQQTDVADDVDSGKEAVFDGFTIAVVRYEYANLYHTTTDWYNAFLMMQFFGRTPAETNILLIDAHPFGALDSVWMRLFGSVTRLSALGTRTRFRQLVWSIVGYESPMKIYLEAPYPPLFIEFRQHVLSSYNINSSSSMSAAPTRNCSALSVLFIWRRNYLAHPRNPTGIVQRKISNERELIEFVQRRRRGFRVSGVQIDLLDFGDQLRRIVDADIVVGVHGAGLTHAVFMRPDAGLAEISPNEVWASNNHFEAIAQWRRMKYIRWINHDFELEDERSGSLKVPPYVANALVGKLAKRICSSGNAEDLASVNAANDQRASYFKPRADWERRAEVANPGYSKRGVGDAVFEAGVASRTETENDFLWHKLVTSKSTDGRKAQMNSGPSEYRTKANRSTAVVYKSGRPQKLAEYGSVL